jgi:hypothetical protein
MGKLKEKIKGEVEKVNADTFQYVPGSICRLDPLSLGEEHWEKKKETFDRTKAGLCLRCGLPVVSGKDSCECGKRYKLIK